VNLYHHTTSAHLPLIIRSAELRPGAPLGNFAKREFVHATDNPVGDRTACGFWTWHSAYDRGRIQRVRFTLGRADFEPWHDVLARYPEWTPDMIKHLQDAASWSRIDQARSIAQDRV
jgi:hypothetical protein